MVHRVVDSDVTEKGGINQIVVIIVLLICIPIITWSVIASTLIMTSKLNQGIFPFNHYWTKSKAHFSSAEMLYC